MNRIVIVFVPTDLSKRELEMEMNKYLASIAKRATPDESEKRPEEWPFWTWFIPNPC